VERGEVKILGLHHVDLRCRADELERSRQFWNVTLGLPFVREWEGGFGVAAGDARIYVQVDDAMQWGNAIHHIALLLPDEHAVVDAERELNEAGFEHSGMIRDPGVRNINVLAPGGSLVELRAEIDA
jgi:catechol 2,3-dioxygenase-like lactoylglutathione lyase family enzyme